MSDSENHPLADWHQAIAAAVGSPRASAGARLFYEAREDLLVEVSSRTGPTSIHTRQTGLSADAIGVGVPSAQRRVHLAEPALDDVARVFQAATDRAVRFPGGSAPATTGLSVSSPLPDQALAWIDRAHREIARLAPRAHAHSRWVQFDQHVVVGEPGPPVAQDRRRGCRVHVQAWLDGPSPSHAVAEAVLKARGATGLAGPEPEAVAAGLVGRLRRRLHARSAPRGGHAVVLGPGVGGILVHEVVGHALEADTARRGSWLTTTEAPVAPSGLTVVDDPRRGRAAWRTDDEGQPAMATPLIGGGQVRSWLHDTGTALATGGSSTGHGRRSSYREPVRPRMGCTFIGAGRLKPEEVLEGVDGIFVHRMEAATVDPRTGAATFRVTDADIIRRGRLESALHPHMLRIGARETLLNLGRVADDLAFDVCIGSCQREGQPLAVSVGAPTIWIGVVTVIV